MARVGKTAGLSVLLTPLLALWAHSLLVGGSITVHKTVHSTTYVRIEDDKNEMDPGAMEDVPMPETIDLSSLFQANLNPVATIAGVRIGCVKGSTGEEAFASLSRCPTFQPCASLVAGTNNDYLGQTVPLPPIGTTLAPPGGIDVCSTGITDGTDSFMFPQPPMNCASWYGKSQEERDATVRSILGSDMDKLSPEWAQNTALRKLPLELGCGHHKDYVPLEPVEFVVYRLRNVYIGERGGVFNNQTFYFANGCQHRARHYIGAGFTTLTKSHTFVKRVPRAVNWVYHQGINFYHSLIESFPALLSLIPILREYKDIPIMATDWQLESYKKLLQPFLGVSLSSVRHYSLKAHRFVWADELYQPVFQFCGQPSKAVWTVLRRRYLLNPQGIPVLNPDWTFREVSALTDAEARRVPEDWVVVVAQRPGHKRSINTIRTIEEGVKAMFPEGRVVVFKGDLSVLQAKDLFRRTRLYIGGHGAALSNMVFMPEGASVLEIRPNEDYNTCFHALAEACSLRYNLVFGIGNRESVHIVNATQVLETVYAIAHDFL